MLVNSGNANVHTGHLGLKAVQRITYKDGELIPYKCIIGGDRNYAPIACASILAKVYHDEYIESLCEEHPELEKRYSWCSNMCYGTAKHIDGIKAFGISPYHRKTFGICKDYC